MTKRIVLWHLLVVAVACFLAYANSLSGDFIFDDELQVVRNPVIRELNNIPEQFTKSVWSFIQPDTPNQTNFYRPLQTVAYTVGYAIGGLSPVPYHAINLIFHVLASLAVYAICVELGFTGMLALLGATLFGVHTIHTEAVTWIAAAPEVLCGCFYFAGLWAYLKSDDGTRRTWWLASAALFFLGLLSKEMAITLPVLVLLVTFRPGAQVAWARRFLLMVPYAGFAAVYLAMRIHALGFVATQTLKHEASTFDWISLGVRAFGQYIWLALVPYPLIAYRMIPPHFADRTGITLACLGLITLLAVLAWGYRQRIPEAGFWYVAFLLMLAPVFNFKGISAALMSDRYLYIPSLAPILIALAILKRTKAQHWMWLVWGVAGVFTLTTIVRNQDWATPESLYTDTIAKEPNVAEFQGQLAKRLIQQGNNSAAIQHLNQALAITSNPAYYQSYDAYDAHIALAGIYLFTDRLAEADQHIRAAAKEEPNGEMVLVYTAVHRMLSNEQNAAEAVGPLQAALKMNPNNELAHDYLGMAYFSLGKLAEAQAEFQAALRVDPNFQLARQHLAIVSQKLANPF